MERVSLAEYEAAKLEIIKGREYKEYTDMDEYGRNHKTFCCKDGNTFWEITENGVTEFWSTKHSESRKYVAEAQKEEPKNAEERKKVYTRLCKWLYWFADEMFNEEERGEKAQAEFEKECRENPGKQVMYIDTSTNNARVMKTCMKETRDAINFIRNPENDIEDWQLAGITAMLDKCNETGTVPYDIPTAIKGLLCMHILCEGK